MLQINDFDLCKVMSYVFLWTTLYFVLCLWNKRRSYEWHCRMVTVIHAVVISILTAYCAFVLGPWPFTDAGGPNTPMQVRTIGLCLGYFLFDFTWCLYSKTESPIMLLHHFLSIVGMTSSLFFGLYGTELMATILGAELTNPLLQLRWFLRELGHQNSLYADLVEWAFVISFGVIRLGVGSVLLYSYFNQDTDRLGRFGGVCIYSIGVIFYINIINYAIRKYVRRYRAWVKGQARPTSPTSEQASHVRNGRGSQAGSNGHRESGQMGHREAKSNYGEVSVEQGSSSSSQMFVEDIGLTARNTYQYQASL